jgi:hypothetical protein
LAPGSTAPGRKGAPRCAALLRVDGGTPAAMAAEFRERGLAYDHKSAAPLMRGVTVHYHPAPDEVSPQSDP